MNNCIICNNNLIRNNQLNNFYLYCKNSSHSNIRVRQFNVSYVMFDIFIDKNTKYISYNIQNKFFYFLLDPVTYPYDGNDFSEDKIIQIYEEMILFK